MRPKRYRNIAKFTYKDLSKYTGMSEGCLRQTVHLKKINLNDLDTFIKFLFFHKLKKELAGREP
jgi:hypothetical protein